MTKRISADERKRITRSLRRIMFEQFVPVAVMAAEQDLLNRNMGHPPSYQRLNWTTIRVRNEVDVALSLLHERYVAQTGKAPSRGDLISIIVMEALPALVAKTAA
ncbi:hypothetical protein [Sulfitobacter dubius]|uniref:hypothetical protein n=1 Tax=Sulfitobacter dubius TaxID=218673 RepID=UPI0022B031C3|nr:hypothetical protein [Sulfitobacter dubius]MCZ4367544.1 hypothetical protein [Sulfitobacter dubius]